MTDAERAILDAARAYVNALAVVDLMPAGADPALAKVLLTVTLSTLIRAVQSFQEAAASVRLDGETQAVSQ